RIEYAEIAPLPVDLDRDGIARGAGYGAGQEPLLADEIVDQRRFAGIGPADNRDADRTRRGILFRLVPGRFLFFRYLRHQRAQRIVELAHALAMLGGNLNGIAEP